MGKCQVLIVHSSETIADELSRELAQLMIRARGVGSVDEAVALMRDERVEALLLDDGLPDGGSLKLFSVIGSGEVHRPGLTLVGIPRDLYAQVGQDSRDDIEYVPNPESDADTYRLALAIRSRLLRRGLIHPSAAARLQVARQGVERGAARITAATTAMRPSTTLAVVVGILLILLLLLQISSGNEPSGPRGMITSPHAMIMLPWSPTS